MRKKLLRPKTLWAVVVVMQGGSHHIVDGCVSFTRWGAIHRFTRGDVQKWPERQTKNGGCYDCVKIGVHHP